MKTDPRVAERDDATRWESDASDSVGRKGVANSSRDLRANLRSFGLLRSRIFNSRITWSAVFLGLLTFRYANSSHAQGLTASNVGDFRAGAEGSNPDELVNVEGVLYFTADDGVHGREL